MTAPAVRQIPALTSMRFFAALLVLLFHFTGLIDYPPGLEQLVGMGRTGVAFFFVLSGFILAYTYHARFAQGLRASAVRQFLQARFARVYPMHFVVLLVFTPLTLATLTYAPQILNSTPPSSVGGLVQSWLREVFLVQVYVTGSRGIWNGPAWSIACEAFFYLWFPLIILGIARLAQRINLYMLILILFAVQATFHILATKLALDTAGLSFDLVYTSPFLRVWEFGIGCVAGLAFLRGQSGEEQYWMGLRGRRITLLVAFGFIGVGAVLKFLGEPGAHDLLSRVVGETMHEYVAYTLPFTAIIYVSAMGGTFFSHLLENRWLVLLGEASYSLYIIHVLGTRSLRLLRSMGHAVPSWLALLVLLGLIILSVVLLRFVEIPARQWLRPRQADSGRGLPRVT